MTEKEKAEAYDKAIERAKKFYGNGIIEVIFPQASGIGLRPQRGAGLLHPDALSELRPAGGRAGGAERSGHP